MDPMIKRIIIDPQVPLPPKSLRVAGIGGFAFFLGAVLYNKLIVPQDLQAKIAKDMYAKAGH
jgi:hypothetical protein